MKNFILIFCVLSWVGSCSPKQKYKLGKQEIIDYNGSYEQYDLLRKMNFAEIKEREQTVFMYKNKILNQKQFLRKLEKNEPRKVSILESPNEIQHLGFSSGKVKKVVIAE